MCSPRVLAGIIRELRKLVNRVRFPIYSLMIQTVNACKQIRLKNIIIMCFCFGWREIASCLLWIPFARRICNAMWPRISSFLQQCISFPRRCLGYPKRNSGYKPLKADDIELQEIGRQREADAQQIIAVLRQELEEHRAYSNKLESEKNAALTRLSEVISSNLRNNNPNIVDLSDQFRPTKLAEISNELYDNEWTTAFTFLHGKMSGDDKEREIQCIQLLLEILMESYAFCREQYRKEWQDLLRCICGTGGKPSMEEGKQLKDMKQRLSHGRVEEIQRNCLEKLKPIFLSASQFFGENPFGEYINACAKLAWLMQMQDPAVTFECKGWPRGQSAASGTQTRDTKPLGNRISFNIQDETVAPGRKAEDRQPFDRTLYREYTTSGRFIDYVVWPVMFLHEGGPILAKGVAQGIN